MARFARTIVILSALSGSSGFSIQTGPSSSPTSPESSNSDVIATTTSSFDNLGLSPQVLSSVRSQRSQWEVPTEIQRLAIPQLVQAAEGTSFWCQAPTGEGKTLVFGLALLHKLVAGTQHNTNKPAKIRSLILCPTRELVVQIHGVLQNLANNVGGRRRQQQQPFQLVALYGGVPREEQIERLATCIRLGNDIDICIATPGRLVDVLQQYTGKGRGSPGVTAQEAAMERRLLDALENESSLTLNTIQQMKLDRVDDDGRGELADLLDSLEYLVIDESDRLLGRSFEKEMDPLLALVPKVVPAWLFSATYPKHIEPRVNAVLSRLGNKDGAIRISTTNSDRLMSEGSDVASASLAKKLERKTLAVKQKIDSIGPASTIDLKLIRLEKRDRTQALLRLLLLNRTTWDRVLVFVGTRYSSEHVSRKLRRVGVKCSEFHGKLDQAARSRRLRDLRTGKIRVLIATDIGRYVHLWCILPFAFVSFLTLHFIFCSRGLDIVGLPAVVNYDLPRSTADFVHRVGRTGRAGQHGTAVTFLTSETEAHWELIERRHLPQRLERETLDGFEVNEEQWAIQAEASRLIAPGANPSTKGLAHDRMFGGVKGRRKSKKDRLREQAAREVASSA